ncbi:hypothetical protein VIGAN_07180300 [Vigna angularis var. angularis]|uniref:Uncharacterized protein n=1 Tax=Vigna angularis var. angularis TaxID=157739 RepID=A0A0S3SJ79_PHAAN|nr:hypothetical protein VIGAN_07180300 [Vigna angularis var. angularis]
MLPCYSLPTSPSTVCCTSFPFCAEMGFQILKFHSFCHHMVPISALPMYLPRQPFSKLLLDQILVLPPLHSQTWP